MHLKRVNKAMIGGLVAMTAATGLLATTIQPASADPTRPYAAAGSDTIQDVWNGLTNDFGAVAPSIASWNAFVVPPSGTAAGTYTSFIQTKSGGAWFLRPSGSGEGQKAVSAAWDPAYASHQYPSGTGAVLNHEDVDFGRSSGGPSAGTGLKFLPFARDAVSIAYNPYSTLTGLNLTTSEITELYNGVDNTGDSVVQFSEQPATASTVVTVNGVVVHPKIPQNGSGTRGFFLNAIGVTTAQLAPYIPVPNNTVDNGGLPENDGNQIPNDGDLIPFSAAQWIAQNNGKSTDTTSGLALASINGSAPVSGTAPNMTAGALFGHKNLSGKYDQVPGTGVGVFNRDTYDVVPTSFITGTAKQQALISILGAGIGGAGGASVISSYGFGVLSYIGDTSKFLDGAWKH
jgi:hypothetical protein